MNKTGKLVIGLIVLGVIAYVIFSNINCGASSTNEKYQQFYDVVSESQACLDELADDIYRNWHDYIYNDKFSSIESAVYSAQLANADNLATIEENEELIQSLYKELRDSDLSAEIKAVMQAYSEYYELVVNISGSYNSYSASKETCKKALATALKNLSLEI